jgi:hypothetical protein|tara:strand:- start:17 stop:502 length:486 start_codon:yes stop_codon:yes gene_type:complete
MALIATPSELSAVQLLEVFTETVVFSDDTPPEDPPPDPPVPANTGNVLNVTISTNSPTVNVAYSNTSNTMIISGYYGQETFDRNLVKYFTRGQSDLLETPSQTTSLLNIDPVKSQVYNYSADSRNQIDVVFTILTDLGTIELTKTVFNNYSSARDILRNYI